ncbi:MAG: metal ABC transporter substrate-binding protein [Oscillospiraceae bacterium]|nr:metal ABC transporter substrate-binding protein [Oscillospiraceae bacterium]
MKRILSLLLAAALAAMIFAGCAQTNVQEVQTPVALIDNVARLNVVSTIFPGFDFVREIAGDRVNLIMLISPGAESHSFEPSPQDILTIQAADVFIYIGGHSDVWVDRILDSMDTSQMTILSMMSLVDLVESELVEGMEDHDHDHGHGEDDHDDHGHGHEDEHHDDDHDDHGHGHDDHDDDDHDDHEGGHGIAEYDEHVWTSPVNAVRIVNAIASTLAELDSGNADYFLTRASAYTAQLQALDADFRALVDGASRHTLIFGDRFPFRYFVDEYGLSYYAAFTGCSTQTDASPRTIAFLIDKVNGEDIPAVFHIELSNQLIARAIGESTGAQLLELHSKHNLSREEFDAGVTFIDLLRRNLATLEEALN